MKIYAAMIRDLVLLVSSGAVVLHPEGRVKLIHCEYNPDCKNHRSRSKESISVVQAHGHVIDEGCFPILIKPGLSSNHSPCSCSNTATLAS